LSRRRQRMVVEYHYEDETVEIRGVECNLGK